MTRAGSDIDGELAAPIQAGLERAIAEQCAERGDRGRNVLIGDRLGPPGEHGQLRLGDVFPQLCPPGGERQLDATPVEGSGPALGRLGVSTQLRRLAILLPAAYLLADYGENIGIVTMLANYPTRLSRVADLTVVVTLVKSALVALVFVAVAVSYALVVVRTRRRAPQRQPI